MRTEEILDLEDLCLDEPPDFIAAMTHPDLRRYVDVDAQEDNELGLRTLLENPLALSRSLRRQLH